MLIDGLPLFPERRRGLYAIITKIIPPVTAIKRPLEMSNEPRLLEMSNAHGGKRAGAGRKAGHAIHSTPAEKQRAYRERKRSLAK